METIVCSVAEKVFIASVDAIIDSNQKEVVQPVPVTAHWLSSSCSGKRGSIREVLCTTEFHEYSALRLCVDTQKCNGII